MYVPRIICPIHCSRVVGHTRRVPLLAADELEGWAMGVINMIELQEDAYAALSSTVNPPRAMHALT